MSRILLIHLRRSAPGAALTVLLAGMVAQHLDFEFWSDGWMPLAIDQRSLLMFVWPLALAAGAWQARREHRARVHELVESTARPRRLRVLPVLSALALAISAAYVGTSLSAAPRLLDLTSYFPAATLSVIAVGALSVVAAAWLGMALGRLLPSAVTAPALGVVGIGLLIVLPQINTDQGRLTALFSPVIRSGQWNAYFTVPSWVSMAQAGWWLALALTAMVLLAASRSWIRVAALLPLALGAAALTVTHQQHNEHPGVVADPAAQELVCADGTPRVCVSRVHAFVLPEVTTRARQGLTMLARLPEAPTTAIDAGSLWYNNKPEPPPDTVTFPIEISTDGRLSNFLPTMLSGGGAHGCRNSTDADWAADWAAGYWLMSEEPDDHYDAQVHDLWQMLDALPDAEALERVTALRDAARTCSGNRSELLTGGRA